MTNNKKYDISAFFPAYNDEGTIKLMVERLHKVLKKVAKDYEIIIIDDCSPDKSGEIADEIAKKDKKVIVIHHKKNRGYGGALKSGFNTARKELIFYTDGDAQYDVAELEKLIPFIDKFGMVNGYKMNRADGLGRTIIGKLYNFFIGSLLFSLKVKDMDCDFRLMKKEIFNKIKLESDNGSICLELVKKVQNAGYIIENVPVHHYPRIHGKSQFFKLSKILKSISGLSNKWYNLVLLKKTK